MSAKTIWYALPIGGDSNMIMSQIFSESCECWEVECSDGRHNLYRCPNGWDDILSLLNTHHVEFRVYKQIGGRGKPKLVSIS